MVLGASELTRRIQVQRFVETGPDGYGSRLGDWSDHGSPIFARRRDVSDAERMTAGAWDNRLVTRFVVRANSFTRDIRRFDRLVHDGVTFQIDGIKEVSPGRAFLEITAWSEDVA